MIVPIVSLAPKLACIVHPKIRARQGRKRSSHCKQGHPLVEGNLYINPNGHRQCLTCRAHYNVLRSTHGQNRSDQERCDAPRLGVEPRSEDHIIGHSPRVQEGTPWRAKGQFRSHGKAAFQTAGG